MTLRRLDVVSFASVPVRSSDGKILGALTIFGCQPRRTMALDELRMLESLADMVASQLELRRLRKSLHRDRRCGSPARPEADPETWPRTAGSAPRPGAARVCALLPAGGRARHAQNCRP